MHGLSNIPILYYKYGGKVLTIMQCDLPYVVKFMPSWNYDILQTRRSPRPAVRNIRGLRNNVSKAGCWAINFVCLFMYSDT